MFRMFSSLMLQNFIYTCTVGYIRIHKYIVSPTLDLIELYSDSEASHLMTLEKGSIIVIYFYLLSFSFFLLSRSTFVCMLVTDLFSPPPVYL